MSSHFGDTLDDYQRQLLRGTERANTVQAAQPARGPVKAKARYVYRFKKGRVVRELAKSEEK